MKELLNLYKYRATFAYWVAYLICGIANKPHYRNKK
jgi:hypothetical protein